MSVGTSWAKSALYQGRVYYFCTAKCRDAFEAEPDRYVGAALLRPGTKDGNSQIRFNQFHHEAMIAQRLSTIGRGKAERSAIIRSDVAREMDKPHVASKFATA